MSSAQIANTGQDQSRGVVFLERSLVVAQQLNVVRGVQGTAVSQDAVDVQEIAHAHTVPSKGLERAGLRLVIDSLRLSLFALIASLCFASQAFALGVGAAEAESYIGEPLVVRIPLFNVRAPDSLKVELEADRNAFRGQAPLSVAIDRSNSQLGVLISSSSVVAEPYIGFKLNIEDQNSIFTKEFRVLLNLAPVAKSQSVADTDTPTQSQSFVGESFSAQDIVRTEGIMGPYEWAESGKIPGKFGAVLDGQSLWRVARRINKAMGVSQNQMMWSLFQANPSAFSNDTIESLQAGTFLTIPSYAEVSSVSDRVAKQKLDQLSGAVSIAQSDATPLPSDESIDADIETQAETQQPFQLTGIGEAVNGSGDLAAVGNTQSQEIISSLAETVNNLSEQVVQKDKQIEVLQEQVSELKAFIQGSDGFVSDDLDVVDEVSTTSVEEPLQTAADADVDQSPLDQVEVEQASDESSTDLATELVQQPSEVVPVKAATPWWHWALAGLAGFVVLSLLFKARLGKLLRSLNLFGSNDSVAFEPPAQVAPEIDTELNVEELLPKRPEPVKPQDYTSLVARKKEAGQEEGLDGISFQEIEHDDDFEEDDSLEFVSVDEVESDDDGDMTFDERFDRLLEDKDYDFARELLDFARYNEIDDERYHCERLRLFKAMRDEDGFYEYYYEIEAKIPSFRPALQTEISQFVVQLAQS